MFDPGPNVYMMKMATSESYAHLLDLDRPIGETLKLMADEKGDDIGDLVVIMLDRPRHEQMITDIRAAGARIRLIPHGDVSAALLAVTEDSAADLLYGIGGTPEGVLSAAAIQCLGGKIIGRVWPRDDDEKQAALDAGYDLDEVLDTDRLCSPGDTFFSATGVTDGDSLRGVHYEGTGARRGATTESLVMRSRSGTVRRVSARHDRQKLRDITAGARSSSPAPFRRARLLRLALSSSTASSAWAFSAPTTDGARSSRASERRKAWVTITWIFSWVIR